MRLPVLNVSNIRLALIVLSLVAMVLGGAADSYWY